VNELGQASLADQHQALVFDNAQQPSGELCLSMKLVDVTVGLPASILCFFFGFAPVAQNGRSQVCASASMSLDQFPKRIPIALLGHSDQLSVDQFSNISAFRYHAPPTTPRLVLTETKLCTSAAVGLLLYKIPCFQG
jgi:hypothetical protein